MRHRPRSLKTAGVEVRSSSRTSTSTPNPRPTPAHPHSTLKSPQTTHCRHAIDRLKRPDITDRIIPGNWEGNLIIGKEWGQCVRDPGRAHHPLPDHTWPCLWDAGPTRSVTLTCRIQGLPEGAIRTLTWDQGPEMARHQRLTPGTGVEVFFAHPHRSIQPTHCYHPLTPPSQIATTSPTANLTLFQDSKFQAGFASHPRCLACTISNFGNSTDNLTVGHVPIDQMC